MGRTTDGRRNPSSACARGQYRGDRFEGVLVDVIHVGDHQSEVVIAGHGCEFGDKTGGAWKHFGAHYPNGSARFHVLPHRLGQTCPAGSFLSLEHHPLSVAAVLPHLLAAAQPSATSTRQARDVNVLRMADSMRVRAGL